MIAKVNSPEKATQFGPISLCNVVMISKMLVARLKLILPEVIDLIRRAFVLRRLAHDNVLMAYESYHTSNNRRDGKEGLCVAKLGMHKAYDRIEWIFFE